MVLTAKKIMKRYDKGSCKGTFEAIKKDNFVVLCSKRGNDNQSETERGKTYKLKREMQIEKAEGNKIKSPVMCKTTEPNKLMTL